MPIKLATTDAEIDACFPVMVQLRPALVAADFVTRVRRMERDGFRLAMLTADGGVEAVAGFRIYENLYSGRICYVDDLVTNQEARSKGHGAELLQWVRDHARDAGCVALELDSGTQRHSAHRFYFRERMTIANYHFVLPLPPGGSGA
jgi:GNAT superfamily N-acetyltransferase